MTRTALLIIASVSFAGLCSCASPMRVQLTEPAESGVGEAGTGDVEDRASSPRDESGRATAVRPEADVTLDEPVPAEPPAGLTEKIWHIRQFAPTTDEEVADERSFYARLKEAWMARDEVRAFDLLTREMVLRPAHRELHILRAAVVLSGVSGGTLPLKLLGGAPDASASVPIETLLFVVAEYQRGIPERPAAMVPWTGLYHPHLFSRLLGSYVGLWSHGLRPLLRNRALMVGEVGVFEDFDTDSPSLVESLLAAQVLAAGGDAEGAREALKVDLEKQVAPEYVRRWRSLSRALEASLGALTVVSSQNARSLLVVWEKQVVGMIPEAKGTLLILPLAALERLEARREGGERRGGPAIPDALAVREILVAAARARSEAPAAEDSRGEHAEMVGSFLAAAYRLRDFRADSLVRLTTGDAKGILSEGLVHHLSLLFAEEGRRRAAFDGVDGTRLPPDPASEGDGWVVPCGGGTSVWLAP